MNKIEVVAAIVVFDSEILCMCRGNSKHDYLSYKFEFPGGKVERNEGLVDALKRELLEELEMDVNVEDKDFFMTVNHKYPDFEITMHSFVCRVKNKSFVMKEHSDYRWLEVSELQSLDWAAADLPIVNKLVNGVGTDAARTANN